MNIDALKSGLEGDQGAERALLVAVVLPGQPDWLVEDHLDELAALADTAGATVVGRISQPRMKPDSATFIGKGKVGEIEARIESEEIQLLIFDEDLTPVQVRNLEKQLEIKVLDRSGLILDIFAGRARTREAKVQVELAQLEYYYPRLTRMWGHLRGQQGGIGFRGPGETQLEVDRRAVQRRIASLKRDLEKISKQRETRRKGRRHMPTAALVGYTNVGKSTLLNSLTGKSDAFVENRLFATLDAKVRRVESDRPFLLIDTVGFIRKLPHHLVASFRSTLEEAHDADVLVHVADLSHPHVEDQIEQTEKVLGELGMGDKPVQLVFNKLDKVDKPVVVERAREKHPGALFVAASRDLRTWELEERLQSMLYRGTAEVVIALPPDRMGLLDELLSDAIDVRDRAWDEGVIQITLAGPADAIDRFLHEAGNRVELVGRKESS